MTEATRQEMGNDLLVTEHAGERRLDSDVIHLYGHSQMIYWWPVWVLGFLMAAVTYLTGEKVHLGGWETRIVSNNMFGLVYTLVLILVFLFTNLTMRGLVSGMVIMGLAFLAVLMAWLDLWDWVLVIIPEAKVYMNTGFYLLFSSAIFIAWALSFFLFDRMVYWRVSPGQIVYKQLIGGAEQSFDTTGAVFEELHVDFFKHGLLGLGACDLKLIVRGARQADFLIPNVLFGHWKIIKIQNLIKRKPD